MVLACRDMAKGEQAARDIMREVRGAKVVARLLNLADTKSICQFAENIYNSESHANTNSITESLAQDCNTHPIYFQLKSLFTT